METERLQLKAWRRHRVMSLRDLAKAAGVGLETVRMAEHPESPRTLQARTVHKLAAALATEPRNLFRLPREDD